MRGHDPADPRGREVVRTRARGLREKAHARGHSKGGGLHGRTRPSEPSAHRGGRGLRALHDVRQRPQRLHGRHRDDHGSGHSRRLGPHQPDRPPHAPHRASLRMVGPLPRQGTLRLHARAAHALALAHPFRGPLGLARLHARLRRASHHLRIRGRRLVEARMGRLARLSPLALEALERLRRLLEAPEPPLCERRNPRGRSGEPAPSRASP